MSSVLARAAGRARGPVIPFALILSLALAPLAIGSIHPQAWVPLLGLFYVAGLVAWGGARIDRARGGSVPDLPGWQPLLAINGLVLLQLVPLPSGLLARLSPGSYAACCIPFPVGGLSWYPISVSPGATLRGLAFLAGMSWLYVAVFRELSEERWRRRLCGALVVSGMILTLAALIQEASAQPHKIYGLLSLRADWAVFGPYVNRNHFAGFLAMVTPIAIGFAVEAVQAAAGHWRRVGFWAMLGTPAGGAALLRPAAAAFLLVGLFASGSRGGLMAFAASGLAFLLMSRRRRLVVLLVLPLLVLGPLTRVDLTPVFRGFDTRGFNRWELWRDAARLVPQFPLLGSGFNAFAVAYRPYQTLPDNTFWGEAHNDYLQALFDTGVLGLGVWSWLVLRLLVAGARARRADPISVGILAAIAAAAAHALVDFNWQIPANAATFVALVGLAVRQPQGHSGRATRGA